MAPLVPAEIDLFTVPHSRMKELVNKYSFKVHDVDYRNCQEVLSLLKGLQMILHEFKSHESIENLFIMDQLKRRLKDHHIYNSAVCNCHNDNRLQEMLNLVKNGKKMWKTSIGERILYGHELQKAFNEFVQQFLPHMEEEENIFQPLMVEHFEYNELKVLKQVVLEQHEMIKDPQYQEKYELDSPEMDSAIKDFRDLDSSSCCLSSLYDDDNVPTEMFDKETIKSQSMEESFKDDIYNDLTISQCYIPIEDCPHPTLELPVEILTKVFQFLDPPDRGRCAQVCLLWNDAIYSCTLWKEIYPVQWARGMWEFADLNLSSTLHDEGNKSPLLKGDEDADIDESEDFLDPLSQNERDFFISLLSYFLPRVGHGIEKIVLDGGQGISPRLLHQTLSMCPNLLEISATYTFFDYYTLKRLTDRSGLRKLKKLDLEGCESMDNQALVELSLCLLPRSRKRFTLIQNHHSVFDNRSPLCQFRSNRQSPNSSSSCCHRSCKQRKTSKRENCDYPNNDFNKDQKNLSTVDDEFEIEELGFYHSSNEGLDNSTIFEDYRYSSTCAVQRVEISLFEPTLKKINLSGCWRCTNDGLMALLDSGCLKNINSLNLSSCFNLSGDTLLTIAKNCLLLEPENLTYCCNIINGPYSTLASGCDSISHPLKVCCRNSFKN